MDLPSRLASIEAQWRAAKAELRLTRDWRVEAHLHFVLIDLARAHAHIRSLITASTAA